jgi:D-alanyl-D-alanine carboxypeptidase
VAARTVRLASAAAVGKSLRPQMRPGTQAPVLVADAETIERAVMAAAEAAARLQARPEVVATAAPDVSRRPERRPAESQDARRVAAQAASEPEVVTRVSTSDGRHWGVNVGRYPSEFKARQVLLQTALAEMATLEGSLRKVVRRPAGFDANFMGMSRESADLACRRLQARKITCFMIGPG